MKTLTIKLISPLQSYGNEASFNRRTTFAYPSKSTVIGLIAAARGYRRDDNQIRNLNRLKMGVRIDQPGQNLTDFQVAEFHKSASKTARKITYRDYLQDAVFVVAVGSDNGKLIEKIEYALHHPYFQLFLGRRANVPAGVLQTKIFKNKNPLQVLKDGNQLPWQASKWYQKRYRQEKYNAEIIADADLLPGKQNFLIKDLVGSFDQRHRFHNYRAASIIHTDLMNPFYGKNDTAYDIMSFLLK